MKKLLAITLLLSTHALAGDREGTTVWGIGGLSCGKYLDAVDNHHQAITVAALTWAQGYLTGTNVELILTKHQPLRFTEPEQITAYMQKYCRDNPLEELYLGVARLSNERNPSLHP